MGVSNIWHILNLRSTPFFQDALEPGSGTRYPLSLFVGRTSEARTILAEIGGSDSSRTSIQGGPGVGKTTLVNYIKATVAENRYVADADPISVVSASTSEQLLIRILTSVHDALVARDETLFNLEPMRKVRQLLDIERSRSYSMTGSLAGLAGLGFGGGEQRHTGAGALTVQPHRLLRQLSDIAIDRLQTPGVLIHLDNLENATEADQQKAAQMIRDLRDTGLMYEGFHFLLVGTDDAIRTVVAAQEQLRSVFHSPAPLLPLTHDELEELLAARYRHLRLSDDREPLEPVTRDALTTLYDVFEGNLRGTLHALNEAAKSLIGHGEAPTDPMTMETMRPVLQTIYAAKMDGALTSNEAAYVQVIARRGLDVPVTQAEATRLLKSNQKTTSETFASLRTKGYLAEGGTIRSGQGPGRPAQTYHLTGAARIALGALNSG